MFHVFAFLWFLLFVFSVNGQARVLYILMQARDETKLVSFGAVFTFYLLEGILVSGGALWLGSYL